MLRLEIDCLGLKKCNQNASLYWSISGTRRWRRKHWEKKGCLHLGHGETNACYVWDKADFQSRSLEYGKRNLEYGDLTPQWSPQHVLLCFWWPFLFLERNCAKISMFLSLCSVVLWKKKKRVQDPDLSGCHRRFPLSLICSSQDGVKLLTRSGAGLFFECDFCGR